MVKVSLYVLILVKGSINTGGYEFWIVCSNVCNLFINWANVNSGKSGLIKPFDLYSL